MIIFHWSAILWPLVISSNALAQKAGLAWASGPYVPMTAFQAPNTTVSWYYTWSSTPVTYTRSLSRSGTLSTADYEFVPQLWGVQDNLTTAFLEGIQSNFSGVTLTSDRAILTYNEGNQVGQAWVTPALAAAHWQKYVEPLRGNGWRIGSPVTTSAPDGKVWMNEFKGNCTGCDWDFTTVHWYDIDADAFIEYVTDFYYTFNKTIWVTEFACHNFNGPTQANASEIAQFLSTTLAFLDSTSWIERYAYFAPAYDMVDVNPLNSLFANDTSDFTERSGVQSVLGMVYAGVNGTEYLKTKTSSSGSGGGSTGGGGVYSGGSRIEAAILAGLMLALGSLWTVLESTFSCI